MPAALRPSGLFSFTVAAFGWRLRFALLRSRPRPKRPTPAFDADRDRVLARAALDTRLSAHLRNDVGAGEG